MLFLAFSYLGNPINATSEESCNLISKQFMQGNYPPAAASSQSKGSPPGAASGNATFRYQGREGCDRGGWDNILKSNSSCHCIN